ncbi:DNA recombination protein RmuC [Sphingomonas cavernae]|uniref:DNA recombination protein RmuC homolog n=1 Tax=Sphingomonas cavernae TaxID=2320861 RepID=A0A418WN32_9SPHN|nr:DNA recombination protein RmuC [Sphingomonas cavernae]RJF91414.1 DNA recombination protein RmuC [Sphingomonas cavernae]
METPLVMVAIVVALLAGLALGWFLGGRGTATVRSERDHHLDNFRKAITDLAGAEERAKAVPQLQQALADVSAGRETARTELAALRAERTAREQALQDQIKALLEAKDALSAQFSEVGQKLLSEAQRQFLDRADQRFHQAGEKSEAQLKALLNPVETTLKRYEEGLQRVEKERVDSYAGLREQMEQVRVGQGQVKDEAARLVNALRSSPKARGRWGEQSLRNVLEQAGLSPHADFRTEVSVDTDDGRLRPDVIVRLPGGRELVIDAKCSLNAYLDASEEVDEAIRLNHLKMHAASIRNHARQLGEKGYWERFGKAADYVVMYIPGEHFLSAALEQDDSLWDWAFERRVLLATPTNLVAIARTVASVWRQEKLAEEAQAIGALGKEMYERLATAAGHLKRVGGGLNSAVDNYNKFVASFEGRVLVTGRKFRDLNVETGAREIEAIESVDTLARQPPELLPSPAEIEDRKQDAAE